VSAASVTQFAHQTEGSMDGCGNNFNHSRPPDLLFSAASRCDFFADIVGLSVPPDEIASLTLINSYGARAE
jgi:hypothetical protein